MSHRDTTSAPLGRLEFCPEPVRMDREQLARETRRGLVHRLSGNRYLVTRDEPRGVHTLVPVVLSE